MADLAFINGGKSNKLPLGSEAWADQLRQETKVLAQNIEQDYLRMAKNLWELFDKPIDGDPKKTNWLTQWKFENIGDYAEKELGIHKRIAERLRRIWAVAAVECKLDESYLERFAKMGRSRARILTRPGVLTEKSAKSWIDKAEKLSYRGLDAEVTTFLAGRDGVMKGTLGKIEPLDADGEVVEEEDEFEVKPPPIPHSKSLSQTIAEEASGQVKGSLGTPLFSKAGEPEKETITHKTFALFPDQWDSVKAALERASELSGSKKDGQNLSLMALDFVATNEFKSASLEQTQRFFKRMEKALEVKIIVLTPKDHEILYGYKTLEKILNK